MHDHSAQHDQLQRHACLSALALLLALLCLLAATYPAAAKNDTYTNPLPVTTPGGMRVESCADPTVIAGPETTPTWYMACTTDPLSGTDRDGAGNLIFHLIPLFRSTDLVNWTYLGDAFASRPAWAAADAGLWAPDFEFFNGQYYLYFTVNNTSLPGGGSAIGVATAPSPAGPWVETGAPVIEPHAPECCPNDKRWVFDPDVIEANGQRIIYYGSYFGGISARTLAPDGLTSDPASQVQIAIPNRYEGAFVMAHDGYFYLFASATDCCRGPLTGYSVFVGRATNPLGPFVDAQGNSFLAGRVGGTPVISMNGNRWVGPGHNTVVADLGGQDWFVYHAIDRNDPYFAGNVGFTKRPVLMDPLDWVNGWPTVRGGYWASSTAQRAPVTAATPGNGKPRKDARLLPDDKQGKLQAELADEFNGSSVAGQWTWVRPPAAGSYGIQNGVFRFDTQAADLYVDSNDASVLVEGTPKHDYLVETKVRLNLPAEGCCFNYVQAGLVIYGDDDNFIKLAHASIWETRQTEFAKEQAPVPAGYPRYGNSVIGAPGEWTWLRIAQHRCGNEECYTGYTSQDGTTWVRGGTWTQQLGANARIGLVAMGGTGFTAEFDYVRVYRLNPTPQLPD